MSENDNIDDEFDGENENGSNDSDLVKNLRKQLKAAQKEKTDAQARINEFEAAKRKSTVAETLKKRNAPEGLSKFFTGDDASAEAVDAWLTENAELFGIELQGDDLEQVEQAESVSRVTSNATQTFKPGTNEAIAHALATKSDAELIELGYIRKG